jgi:hypothetical protein
MITSGIITKMLPKALSRKQFSMSAPRMNIWSGLLREIKPKMRTAVEKIPAKPFGIVQEIADWVIGLNPMSNNATMH